MNKGRSVYSLNMYVQIFAMTWTTYSVEPWISRFDVVHRLVASGLPFMAGGGLGLLSAVAIVKQQRPHNINLPQHSLEGIPTRHTSSSPTYSNEDWRHPVVAMSPYPFPAASLFRTVTAPDTAGSRRFQQRQLLDSNNTGAFHAALSGHFPGKRTLRWISPATALWVILLLHPGFNTPFGVQGATLKVQEGGEYSTIQVGDVNRLAITLGYVPLMDTMLE